MKIIAIEGLDKSGKYTQSMMLRDRLEKDGFKAVYSAFHRYDTPTGKLIQEWLYKKYEVDQYTIELIMTADKQAQQKWFHELEFNEKVDFLILDRYIASQVSYGFASSNNKDWDWLLALQEKLRKPDLEILIDIPAEVSINRKGKYFGNDRYESDLNFLQTVRRFYKVYFNGNWPIVDGKNTIDQIHSDIYNEVVKKFILGR